MSQSSPSSPTPGCDECSWTGPPVSFWASFPAFFLCTSAVLGVLEAISVCALTCSGLLSLHPHPSPQLVFLCPFVLEVSGPCSQYGWDGGEGGPGVTAPFHSLRCETHASLFFFSCQFREVIPWRQDTNKNSPPPVHPFRHTQAVDPCAPTPKLTGRHRCTQSLRHCVTHIVIMEGQVESHGHAVTASLPCSEHVQTCSHVVRFRLLAATEQPTS